MSNGKQLQNRLMRFLIISSAWVAGTLWFSRFQGFQSRKRSFTNGREYNPALSERNKTKRHGTMSSVVAPSFFLLICRARIWYAAGCIMPEVNEFMWTMGATEQLNCAIRGVGGSGVLIEGKHELVLS
jgi:hypothetical protein